MVLISKGEVKGHSEVDWVIIVWQAGTIHRDYKISIGIFVVEVKGNGFFFSPCSVSAATSLYRLKV